MGDAPMTAEERRHVATMRMLAVIRDRLQVGRRELYRAAAMSGLLASGLALEPGQMAIEAREYADALEDVGSDEVGGD